MAVGSGHTDASKGDDPTRDVARPRDRSGESTTEPAAPTPAPIPAQLLRLQRSAGNAAVARYLSQQQRAAAAPDSVAAAPTPAAAGARPPKAPPRRPVPVQRAAAPSRTRLTGLENEEKAAARGEVTEAGAITDEVAAEIIETIKVQRKAAPGDGNGQVARGAEHGHGHAHGNAGSAGTVPVQRGIWGSIKGAASSAWDGAKSVASGAVSIAKGGANLVGDALKQAVAWGMANVVGPMKGVGSSILGAGKWVGSKISNAYSQTKLRWSDILMPWNIGVRFGFNLSSGVLGDVAGAEGKMMRELGKSVGYDGPMPPGPIGGLNKAMRGFQKAHDAVTGVGDEIVEGAILGDFKENPTIWNTIGQVAIGFVPYAGQVADLRDTVAAIKKLHETGGKDIGAWANLALTLVGWVPGLGDIVKGVGKTAIKHLGKWAPKIWRGGKKLWKAIADGAPKLARGAWNLGKRAWGGIKGFAKSLGSRAKSGLKSVVGKLKSVGRKAADIGKRIMKGAGDLAKSIGNKIKGLVSKGKGLLSRATRWIADKASSAFNAVKSKVSSIASKVKSGLERVGTGVKNLFNKTKAKLTEGFQKVKAWGKSIGDRIKKGVSNVASKIKQKFNDVVAAGKRLIARAKTKLREFWGKKVKGVGKRVKDGIKGAGTKVRKTLDDFFEKVTGKKPKGETPGGGKKGDGPDTPKVPVDDLRKAPTGTKIPIERIEELGIPKENYEQFVKFAETNKVVIDVRPTNPHSVKHLKAGAHPKPEAIKAKTVTEADLHLFDGLKKDDLGTVGYFKPKPLDQLKKPPDMPADEWAEVLKRHKKRTDEFAAFSDDMAKLKKEGKLADFGPDGGVMKHPDGKPYAGDHDVYKVQSSEPGKVLTDKERVAVTDKMKQEVSGVEHGAHLDWKPKNPKEEKIKEGIINDHTSGHKDSEGLVRIHPDGTAEIVYHGD